ncbi:STAS domain-containing protein [Nocardia sp. NPDC020380]|uniref:STAS domain-containing protein n=1 Tax=Nocardia sp. NPDC020380 TaxID=3364309 RepID=UPI0037883D48
MSGIAMLGGVAENGATTVESAPVHRGRYVPHATDGPRRCVIVRAEGELDAAVEAEFTATLAQAVAGGAQAVVVDLRRARFLSIRVAAGLIVAKRAAAACDIDLRLVAGRRAVERVLEVTGIRPLFHYYPTITAALQA